MKKLCLLTLLISFPFTAIAQEMDHSAMGHAMSGMESMAATEKTEPVLNEEGEDISTYKRGPDGQPALNYGSIPMHDNAVFYTVRANRFEQRFQDGDNMALWDVIGWAGDDYNKVYFKSEGDYNTSAQKHESTRTELLYSRNVSTFWDIQGGLRHDFIKGADDRDYAALSFYGMAPYWFEVDASSYVSDEGDISARIEAEYDLMLSQRLILQPRFETELAMQDVQEYNVGSGINSIEFGTRLRYEITRKIAPYVGVEWTQNLGETKNLLEAAGEDTEKTAIVAGIRFWF